jgi:hypothetical protein
MGPKDGEWLRLCNIVEQLDITESPLSGDPRFLSDHDISDLHQHRRRTRRQGLAANPRHDPAQSWNQETIEILMVEAVVRSGNPNNIRGIVETLQNPFIIEEEDLFFAVRGVRFSCFLCVF